MMPKTSPNDQISAAFEEIAEALINPKLQEGFPNRNKENEMLNEIVGIFDRQTTIHRQRVLKPGQNTKKVVHVPVRVENPMCEQKKHRKQNNTKKKENLFEKEQKKKCSQFTHVECLFTTSMIKKILESHDVWILSTNRILQSKI